MKEIKKKYVLPQSVYTHKQKHYLEREETVILVRARFQADKNSRSKLFVRSLELYFLPLSKQQQTQVTNATK